MPGKELVDVTNIDPIVLSNVLEIIKRSRVGVAKYGTTLAENSSDDFLQHAKEEAMDFINDRFKKTRNNEEFLISMND